MTAVLTTLVSFDSSGPSGVYPHGSLLMDGNGNLFGTTESSGGPFSFLGAGTVFEIAKTATGYASAPTTLLDLGQSGGGFGPLGSLIADANGNLFGTTKGAVVFMMP